MKRHVEKALAAEMKKKGLRLGAAIYSGDFADLFKVYKDNSLFGILKIAKLENIRLSTEISPDRLAVMRQRAIQKESDMYTLLASSRNVMHVKEGYTEVKLNNDRYCYIITEPNLISLNKAEELLKKSWFCEYGKIITLVIIGLGVLRALKDAVIKIPCFSHRDIKPANIFILLMSDLSLSPDRIKLGDFGICNSNVHAETFHADVRNNSDMFKSPDVIKTISSDIDSLGRILRYYLSDLIPERHTANKESSDLADEFEQILDRMTARPANRIDLDSAIACFESFYNKYKVKISEQAKLITDDLNALNGRKATYTLRSHGAVRSTRYTGISYFLKKDYNSAIASWKSAGDSASRFYIASVLAANGQKQDALRRLIAMKAELPATHPLYDNVLALLYSLGSDDALTELEKTSARCLLRRDEKSFSFI